MNNAQTLFDTFSTGIDPKIIIASAHAIKKHFSNVCDQSPQDEIAEEFLYLIDAKNESFEWMLLLIILQINSVGYGEYFTAISNREQSLQGKECKWANSVLKEIRPQIIDTYKVYCDDLIAVFERVIERDLLKKKEVEKNYLVSKSSDESSPTVSEKKYPALLLILHDKIPIDKNGFVNSVIKSLDYSIGPDTKIVAQQYNSAQSLDSALPFALASAMAHFKKYSLALDTDETIYSRFKSTSSGHFIQGHSFGMFSKLHVVNLNKAKKKGFWSKLFNKIKSVGEMNSSSISVKDNVKSKGDNIQIISIDEFHNYFLKLAKKFNTSDPDVIFSKIGVFCESCNIQYTKEALEVLNISKMFGGAKTFVMGATQEGNDLRSGKCPKCGHTKMSILINN